MLLPAVVNPFPHLAALLAPGGQVHFMPNGGNLGDALINQAAIQAVRTLGAGDHTTRAAPVRAPRQG